jgi:hypothetical protein
MSTYNFGCGPGHLPERVRKIAAKHGADTVNYTDTACICGKGCRPHTCPQSRRHWFEIPNRGEPFNSRTEREVMAAIEQAGHR